MTPYQEGRHAGFRDEAKINPYRKGWAFLYGYSAARWAAEWDAGYDEGQAEGRDAVIEKRISAACQ
jgi:hypothetical protein